MSISQFKAGLGTIPQILMGLALLINSGCLSESASEAYLPFAEVPFETVPAGNFTWSSFNQIQSIDYDYAIQRFEVTNGQFADYLRLAWAAGEIAINDTAVVGSFTGDERWPEGEYEYFDLHADGNRISFTGSDFQVQHGFADHPVVEVTWFGAAAFAEFYQLRLPTNREWEKAARGSTGLPYPWGMELDGRYANFGNSGDPFDNGTTPIGFFDGRKSLSFQTLNSPSAFNAYDMVGNVWEWIGDYAGTSVYKPIRGGSWSNSAYLLKTTYYSLHFPYESSGTIGFRLAKDM
jgi:formylglycine-generating enzyme required for sulfatase activity